MDFKLIRMLRKILAVPAAFRCTVSFKSEERILSFETTDHFRAAARERRAWLATATRKFRSSDLVRQTVEMMTLRAPKLVEMERETLAQDAEKRFSKSCAILETSLTPACRRNTSQEDAYGKLRWTTCSKVAPP